MNFIEASVFMLFIAVISVPLAERARLPLEIFLFVGSCLLSLIPGVAIIHINPMVVFDILLPPILFSAAYFTSWREFKYNLRPISQLAFGLVIFSTVVVAVMTKYVIPSMSWPEAFLLGAIVSPTDASAATSILKRFPVPRRFIVLLEGESLVNDATALILYRFSLTAIIYNYFSITDAIGKFIVMAIGGVCVGFVISYTAVFILRRIHEARAETILTFVAAFSAYIIAEQLGFSGVISTVTAGLYFGSRFPQYASSQTKITAKGSWASMMFVINGFAFTLIGFELPLVMKNLGNYSIIHLVLYGTIISLVVIAARLIWLYPSSYIPRKMFPALAKKDPMPSPKFLFMLGWTGMRGIVSLAAALAIPHFKEAGAAINNLDLIVFITYFVVVVTLVIPAITLPLLIRFFGIYEPDNQLKEEAAARVKAAEHVIEAIKSYGKEYNIAPHIITTYVNQSTRKLNMIKTQLADIPYSMLQEDFIGLKKLNLIAIKVERSVLLTLRRKGEIRDEIFWHLTDELDLEEERSKGLRT